MGDVGPEASRIQFNASGQVAYAPGDVTGPSGARAGRNDLYPVPTMGPGGLIARVGDSQPFPIGAGARQLTMPANGRLYLGVNDDIHADNTGSFQVGVRRR